MILKSDGIENVILLIKIILQRIICFYKKVLLLIIRFAIRHQWTNKLKKFILVKVNRVGVLQQRFATVLDRRSL